MTRVVQTEISDTEYALLEAYVRSRKSTIKDALREAIRTLALRDEVDPEDPIFHIFPLTKKRIRVTDGSENLDEYVYESES